MSQFSNWENTKLMVEAHHHDLRHSAEANPWQDEGSGGHFVWRKPLLSLFIMTIILFTLVASVHAQTAAFDGAAHIEALKIDLETGKYLDAYDEVLMLNDSAPVERNALLSAAPQTDADAQARIFVLLFSHRPEQARMEAKALADSVFADVVAAAANESLGNTLDSAKALESAFKQVSAPAQLYGLIAAADFDKGSAEDLLDNVGQAIDLDPQLTGAYRLRGLAKLYTGNPQAALADADQAIALDPVVYFFHYLRGNAHFALGDPQAALSDFEAGLALNPQSVIGYAMRSKANMALGNIQQAAQDFAASIKVRTSELVQGDALVADQPIQVTMTFGRTFHLPFEAQAGQSLGVSVTSVHPGEVDPVVMVLSPEGAPLAYNDDASDESLDAQVADYLIPANGTYTVVVSQANGGSEGPVEITLTLK